MLLCYVLRFYKSQIWGGGGSNKILGIPRIKPQIWGKLETQSPEICFVCCDKKITVFIIFFLFAALSLIFAFAIREEQKEPGGGNSLALCLPSLPLPPACTSLPPLND